MTEERSSQRNIAGSATISIVAPAWSSPRPADISSNAGSPTGWRRRASTSFASYFAQLRGDLDGEIEQFVNAFTVNETYFYREDHQLRMPDLRSAAPSGCA